MLRDDAGVPQLYADTAADLFFAQGYVQAQDRFFEMDVRRHITVRPAVGDVRRGHAGDRQGRPHDGVAPDRRAGGGRLDPETVAYLEAFSAGVNAYLEEPEPGELSLEYTLLAIGGLDYTVEEWTPADSVAWLKAMAWDLRGNMQDEVDRAMASTAARAGADRRALPAVPLRPAPADRRGRRRSSAAASTPTARRAPAAAGAGRPRAGRGRSTQLEALSGTLDAMPLMVGRGDGIGSNAWVVDGDHSTTGEPILANDPHLAPTLPGVWYQMGLHCTEVGEDCPFDVSGLHLRRVPRRDHRPQPADRLGVHEPRPGRDRPLPRGGRRRALPARHEVASRSSGARRRSEIAGEEPFTFTVRTLGARPAALRRQPDLRLRRRERPGRRPRPRPRLPATPWRSPGRRCDPTRTAEAVFAINRADGLGASSATPPGTSPLPARTWCTPTAPATSATRPPG